MASPAAVLSILVEANTSAANANLAKTNAELDATKASALGSTTATSKAGSAMKKMGTMAKWGGAALAVGFVAAAKKSVDTTNELTKSTLLLQKNFGLSGKAASEWAGVARARGADSTKLGMAFKTLATQITAARDGSDAASMMFDKLGFSARDVEKASTDTQFALKMVADGLNAIPPGADKAAISGKLFGRSWATIAPVLRDGSVAMQDQLDTVEKYGGVLQGKTLKQQEDFLAVQRESKIAWQGMQVTLGTALTPALVQVNEQFQKIARIMASKKLTDDEKFQRIADIIEKDMSKALDVIVKMIPTIASRVGAQAPKIAKGLVEGFLKADIWGKLLIGTWLISKFGGWSAIGSLGGKIGSRIGARMSTTVAERAVLAEGSSIPALMVARQGRWAALGATLGTFIGPAIAVAMMPFLSNALDDWLARHGIDLPERHGGTLPAEAVGSTGSIVDVAGKVFGGGEDTDSTFSQKHLDAIPRKSLEGLRDLARSGVKQYGTLIKASAEWGMKTRMDFRSFVFGADTTSHQYTSFMKLLRNADDLSKRDIHDLAKITGLSMADIRGASGKTADKWSKDQKKVRDAADKTKDQVSSATAKQAQNVINSYGNARDAVNTGLNSLKDSTNAALKALGLDKAVQFRTNEAPIGKGGVGHRAQRGAVIPGTGDGDKVHVMAEPGEGFINKTAVKALGGPKAINAINAAIPRFARGGSVGGDTAGLVAPFLGALHSMSGATHTPINVISGFRSRAEQERLYQLYLSGRGNLAAVPGTSHHELGIAADISPGRETFGGVAGKFGMGFTVPSESWHIELLNAAAGKFGAGPQKIARIILQGPAGAVRNMGQGSLDKTRNAANAFIRKQWQQMGQLNFTGGKFDLNQLAQLWIGARGSRGIAPLMAHVAMAESEGDPNARNPSGASGLWQILGQLVPGNIFDPHINALNAVAKYKTQGLGAWAASQSAWGQYAQKGGMVLPYIGKYHDGGIAPREGLAHVAKGESIGRSEVNVHLSFANGMEWLREFVNVEIDDRALHDRQLSRMR